MSIIDGIRAYYPMGGLPAIGGLIKNRLTGRHDEIPCRAPGIMHRLWMRPGTSDPTMFDQVLLLREYEFPLKGSPKVIVDAGANVGYTSVFFTNRYPAARIFAIEPEFSNFRLLEKNTAPYPNITPIQAALWDTNCQLTVSGDVKFDLHCGFRVSPSTMGQGVDAITIPELMSRYNLSSIDILKLDIEGSEKEVLEDSAAWISRVELLALETHERFKPGCSEAVRSATGEFKQRYVKGEVEVYSRK